MKLMYRTSDENGRSGDMSKSFELNVELTGGVTETVRQSQPVNSGQHHLVESAACTESRRLCFRSQDPGGSPHSHQHTTTTATSVTINNGAPPAMHMPSKYHPGGYTSLSPLEVSVPSPCFKCV